MKERELKFDRKKHLIYSKTVKKIIRGRLFSDYSPELAEKYWEDTQRAYTEIIELIPYIGGKKNSQAGSVYDCAALFAYYKAVPDKPSLAEFEKMNDDLFVSVFERGTWLNLNKPVLMKAAKLIWTTLSKRSAKHRMDWPGNYHMEMQPCPEGAKYVFKLCPIAELAKKLGYTELMPAMCNPDYPMLKCLKGSLIRRSTCAFGDQCDFWIVGDKSRFLDEYPRIINDKGFICNIDKNS